jgi:hypothetical protein
MGLVGGGRLRVVHEGTEIAVSHVGRDYDASRAIVAG